MLEETFHKQLNESSFGTQYLQLIESAKNRGLKPEKGYEIHHIHPKALEGSDDESNLVKLTIFEHCIAHYYLAKAVPCWKTLYPILKLSNGQVRKLSDFEQVNLEEICQWSLLLEQAKHLPKSRESVEKGRQSLLAKHMKRTPEHIAKMSRKGMIAINNGNIGKLIYPEELARYLSEGWVRGRSPASKERLSKSHTGLKSNTEGRKVIHLGDQEKKVVLEELQSYLDRGWKLGRASGFAERHGKVLKQNSSTNLGKVRIKKDGVGKMILKDQLQSYLGQGWEMGIVRK